MKKSAKWLIPILWLTFVFGPEAAWAEGPAGPDLVGRLSCQGCHVQAGKGGDLGPGWDGIGRRLSPADIERQIVAPPKGMPNFAHLRPEELQALVDCLSEMK